MFYFCQSIHRCVPLWSYSYNLLFSPWAFFFFPVRLLLKRIRATETLNIWLNSLPTWRLCVIRCLVSIAWHSNKRSSFIIWVKPHYQVVILPINRMENIFSPSEVSWSGWFVIWESFMASLFYNRIVYSICIKIDKSI